MTDPATKTPEPKRKKGRSPSYPAIALDVAIERTRALYDRERQHATPLDTVVKYWGYKSFNGPAALHVAALKKFGLIEDEGAGAERLARVSDLAVDILANPNEGVQKAAIQRAALSPAIHQELWEKYRTDLPSDDTLKWELTRQRSPVFTETGADEFIPQYRQTLAFAQLSDSDSAMLQTVAQEDEEGNYDVGEVRPSRGALATPRHQGRRMTEAVTYAVPVAAGVDVTIDGRFPLSESEWGQFMAVLNAMKPALVAERHEDNPDDD